MHDIDYSPVEANPALEASLKALPGRKIIFTAGDVPHAERVMERLGVAHHFEAIFDIVAGEYWPKPHKQIYEAAGDASTASIRRAPASPTTSWSTSSPRATWACARCGSAPTRA